MSQSEHKIVFTADASQAKAEIASLVHETRRFRTRDLPNYTYFSLLAHVYWAGFLVHQGSAWALGGLAAFFIVLALVGVWKAA